MNRYLQPLASSCTTAVDRETHTHRHTTCEGLWGGRPTISFWDGAEHVFGWSVVPITPVNSQPTSRSKAPTQQPMVDSWMSLIETSRETHIAVSPPPKQWTKQRVVALSHYIYGWYVPQQRIADTPCSSGKRAQTQKPCMSIEITKERSCWLSFSSVRPPSESWTST